MKLRDSEQRHARYAALYLLERMLGVPVAAARRCMDDEAGPEEIILEHPLRISPYECSILRCRRLLLLVLPLQAF